MHIRNDYTQTKFNADSPEAIEALMARDVLGRACGWLMKCAFPEVQNLVGVASHETREALCDRIDAALCAHPEMLEHAVVCDDRNNPPSAVHNEQTIITIHSVYGAGLGSFMFSFSNKEFP